MRLSGFGIPVSSPPPTLHSLSPFFSNFCRDFPSSTPNIFEVRSFDLLTPVTLFLPASVSIASFDFLAPFVL